jgi:putative Ca2+/H+ antiporter (TMEM165/GDT1 family)
MARDKQENDRPAGPQPRYRFRTAIVVVPLLAVLVLAGLHILGTTCSWDAVLGGLRVHDRNRFSSLAVLAAGLLGLLAVVKVLVSNNREQ